MATPTNQSSNQSSNHMKYTLEIRHDEFADNPAQGSDDIQILVAHRNLAIGTHNFRTAEECDRHVRSLKGYAVMPLYAYIHSGTALSLTPFACPWDSGQIGFIAVDAATLGIDKGAAKEEAQAMVNQMNHYLSGDVYGYVIEDEYGIQEESCWGYYGDPDESGCKSDGEAALAALMLNPVT